MRIFIVCSKAFYDKVLEIKKPLEEAGHTITLPNSFDNPAREDEMRVKGELTHAEWKAEMIKEQNKKIALNDAILVINYKKDDQENYIGGATFLEIYKAFELGKKIFFYNPVPNGILRDELLGMQPTIINGNLALIEA
ncbi:MAG TPA: hypothetical protein VNA68_02890 [Candidatus Dormibacteraeota bacterium]|nr:hypothetical protein [Candidatus Dormibacteraeota bacterium]